MVTYDNPDLFYEHETVHLIIVNSGATVTGVEDSEPTIENADFVITEADITEDEIELRESLCSANNLKFGSMESACFMFDMFDSDAIPHLKDEEIDVYLYFDEDSSTLFKVGRYIVNEDTFSDDRLVRSILAYDLMFTLRNHDITEWYNRVYESTNLRTIKYLRDSLFEWLATDLDEFSVEQEDTELINDDWLVEKSINSDSITFDFFMQRIAEFNGVFPHMNREGVFCYVSLKRYTTDAVKVFDDELIIPPVKYGGADKDITVWGIGYVIVYDRNNKRLAKVGSSSKKYPSNYKIIDSFVCTNNLNRSGWKTALKSALSKLREAITYLRYKPFEGGFFGNLCYEVGDRIDIDICTYDEETDGVDDDEPIEKDFYTYILERTFVGLNDFEDTYAAKGDKKQPKYKITNSNWHDGDSDVGSTGEGTDGISDVIDEWGNEFVEKIRNTGMRLLDEPNVTAEYDDGNVVVKLKWTDPEDIEDEEPEACEWVGTVVVRTENNPPRHIWDGTIVVDSTTRDEYKEEWLEDNVELNKHYYYGIFPYHLSSVDNRYHYRFTKVISVDTTEYILAPLIENIVPGSKTTWDGSEVEILSSGEYNTLTVQIDDGQYVFKMYKSTTEIYSWTSPVGSTPTDAKKIHCAFLKDDENEVAKPSFVYHTGSGTYSYNQESLTESEMRSIYTWLYPPSYPPEYETYMDKINGTGFFWRDWTLQTATNMYFVAINTLPFSAYSYVPSPSGNGRNAIETNYTPSTTISSPVTVYIEKNSNNRYYYHYDYNCDNSNIGYWGVNNSDISFRIYEGANQINGGGQQNYSGPYSYESTTFSTLAEALTELSNSVRNVHLYVEGTRWA